MNNYYILHCVILSAGGGLAVGTVLLVGQLSIHPGSHCTVDTTIVTHIQRSQASSNPPLPAQATEL